MLQMIMVINVSDFSYIDSLCLDNVVMRFITMRYNKHTIPITSDRVVHSNCICISRRKGEKLTCMSIMVGSLGMLTLC